MCIENTLTVTIYTFIESHLKFIIKAFSSIRYLLLVSIPKYYRWWDGILKVAIKQNEFCYSRVVVYYSCLDEQRGKT